MNHLEFLGGGGGDESPRWGYSPRMRSGGSGDEGSLPNSFGCEFILFIKTHFYGGHSLHISKRSTHLLHLYFLFSWWRHQMETCSVSLAFVRGIHRWLRGFTGHRWIPFTQTSDAELWCFLWSAPDVTVMWCRIVIQWSGQPWDLSAFSASLLSNFKLVKRVKLGGSVHYGRDGLKFGTLLYPDYHSLKLTIFSTQRQFKFGVSDHP